jgi:hypothetical protein
LRKTNMCDMQDTRLCNESDGMIAVYDREEKMDIVNKTDYDVSWFCFNESDIVKLVALGSGDLRSGGGSFSYQPPANNNGLYFVRFTGKGGGTEYAGGVTKQSGQSIDLIGSDGHFQAVVRNS